MHSGCGQEAALEREGYIKTMKEGKRAVTYIKKSVTATLTPAVCVCHYQFVFLSFTMDEKAASSIAFRVHDLTHPHATDPASFLWEPSPAGVISGHNHSLDAHNIAVTKTTTRRGMTTVWQPQSMLPGARHYSWLVRRNMADISPECEPILTFSKATCNTI